jgi:hypothetical protein
MFLEIDKPVLETASHLRGFYANKNCEEVLFHHHEKNGLLYQYPHIQYKIIQGKPLLIGVGKGAEVLENMFFEDGEIRLGENSYRVLHRNIQNTSEEIGISSEEIEYRFITPWIALSQKNYALFYLAKNQNDRIDLLNRILIGNILSIGKSVNYRFQDSIQADIKVSWNKGCLKNVSVIFFSGSFKINVLIPEYLGVGKSVSRGFGTVMREKRGID